jgi:protein phosphatase 1 regulatory subunit 10
VVKKETRSIAPPVKDAKADSSFFSAPKPKSKLPTFKKAAVVGLIKKEDMSANSPSNVAQPSNFDPFQEALKAMKVARRDSPAVSTPPPQSSSSADSNDAQNSSTTLKKKKSVTWAPDGKLESIKLIERAVYDDDTEVRSFSFSCPCSSFTHARIRFVQVKYGKHSFRDLDREEGAALHARLFEEAIDWYDPFSK